MAFVVIGIKLHTFYFRILWKCCGITLPMNEYFRKKKWNKTFSFDSNFLWLFCFQLKVCYFIIFFVAKLNNAANSFLSWQHFTWCRRWRNVLKTKPKTKSYKNSEFFCKYSIFDKMKHLITKVILRAIEFI